MTVLVISELTLLSGRHVLLKFEFPLTDAEHGVLYGVFTDQLDHLHIPVSGNIIIYNIKVSG